MHVAGKFVGNFRLKTSRDDTTGDFGVGRGLLMKWICEHVRLWTGYEWSGWGSVGYYVSTIMNSCVKNLRLSWWAVKFWRESLHRICTGRNKNYIFMFKVVYQKHFFALFSCRRATEQNRTGHRSVACIPAYTRRGLLVYRMLELAFWPSMYVCWCGGLGGRL